MSSRYHADMCTAASFHVRGSTFTMHNVQLEQFAPERSNGTKDSAHLKDMDKPIWWRGPRKCNLKKMRDATVEVATTMQCDGVEGATASGNDSCSSQDNSCASLLLTNKKEGSTRSSGGR
jgi:hypothetical protein